MTWQETLLQDDVTFTGNGMKGLIELPSMIDGIPYGLMNGVESFWR